MRRPCVVFPLLMIINLLAIVLIPWLMFPVSAKALDRAEEPRRAVRLDGQWEVEQGSMNQPPALFSHHAQVPGLLDMAQPAFAEVGRKSALREAFWYRRAFRVEGSIPDSAILKIHKARYGTKVFLNGQAAGEHLPCFTPAQIDLKPWIRANGGSNELIIRVGADRESLPPGMPGGWDFEKYLYIPGIYDGVELILTGAPRIVNVQLVPDIERQQVRILAEVQAGGADGGIQLTARVTEADGGRPVGSGVSPSVAAGRREMIKVDFTVPMPGCRLWSPEDPFLYNVRLGSGADAVQVRFGMRSFRFDPQSRRALLNGRPYFMRGTNVTAYRFFEDAERGDKPWRPEWVRRLHRQFKSMHWNSVRYCIGFPPESWYDIADEVGLLIQDEFPIWLLGNAPEKPAAEFIIPQYTEWMRERWNHPCVVIWDAQNESHTAETGKAIQAVRRLDLSGRPWDNGWAEPQSAEDCVEAHPYLFIRNWQGKQPFRLSEMPSVPKVPPLQKAQQKLPVPIIINEYAWLWLTRDGNPTCLTDKVYESLLGVGSTSVQRRTLYARLLAAKTEFWRCNREVAGVLEFCSLGYSRPGDKPRPEGGATSDHWIDLERLAYEPHFWEYVRDAFNPAGIMLNFWDEEVPPAREQEFEVYVINDLYSSLRGRVRLRISAGSRTVSVQEQAFAVDALGRQILRFVQKFPARPGAYTLAAELVGASGRIVRSLRDVSVK